MSLYEKTKKDPALSKAFNEGIVGRSAVIMKKIVEIYNRFEGLASLVHVGGGTGACLNIIVSNFPSIEGINFDLSHVVQTAPTYPGTYLFSIYPIFCSEIILKRVLFLRSDSNGKRLQYVTWVLPNLWRPIYFFILKPIRATASRCFKTKI